MSLTGRATGALLATGLVATLGLGSYWTAGSVQAAMADQARVALEARQLVATVQFNGRDAMVWAATDSAREQAVAAVRTVPGVRVVAAGEGTAPENATAGSTVTVTRGASSARPSASSTPVVTASPTITPSSVPTTSTTPSVTTTSPTPTPTPAPKTVTIPAWAAIQFAGGTATLDATDRAELVQIAQFMVANPTVRVTLTGHTDMGRTEAERQALGMARAKACAGVLTANGVAAARISTLTRGGIESVASNTTAQGRAANRRVTVAMTQEG